MESASKRKAAGHAGGDGDSRPAKRQKVPVDSGNHETVDTTTTAGLKFLESLKQAKDKTGRPIAVHFLTLPSKSSNPEYYEHIKLPLALDSLENKLNRGEYVTLAHLESDCKRLVNNAKAYNDKKSIIYEDAERLRKTASNWMVKHNPAYRDGNYVAVATPIPGEDNAMPYKPIPRVAPTPKAAHVASPETNTSERPRRAAAALQATPVPSRLRQSASAAPDTEEDDNAEFAGKSFQQAQEKILRDIIEYVDPESGLQIFVPFVNLPSRSLKDYYQLIKEPMSLSAVHKKVRGVIGRDAPTGITLLKGWDVFEHAMSLIWINARSYNEDGSDIYNLSIELEELFYKLFGEAKAKVDEPPQPKLKLNMSSGAPNPKQQLKLKLRQSPGSDPNTPRSSGTPGIIVDNEALLRQQRHVMDGINGTHTSRPSSSSKAGTPAASNPFSGARGGSTGIAPIAQMRTAVSPPVLNGFKQDSHSPALHAIRPASHAPDGQRLGIPAHSQHPEMPPPHMTRTNNGSPHPNGTVGQQVGSNNGHYQPPNHYVPPSAPRTDTFRKVPLKNVRDALIPKITLNTHPALNITNPWSVSIPANKTKAQHSATIMVSPAHSYLQITPHVPIAFTDRPYRVFVTVNGNKTLEVNRVPVTAGINGASSPGPGYEGGKKKGEPVYEAKLVGGVNRIEVEIIAEKEKKGDGKDLKDVTDVEKCTVFLHLRPQAAY